MNETELLYLFMAEVPKALPNARIFRRNIVNATVEKNGQFYRARAGIKGQADAYAILRDGGHVEIETKAAKGRLSSDQIAWRDLMYAMNVPYLLLAAKKDEEPKETVARWIQELTDCISKPR